MSKPRLPIISIIIPTLNESKTVFKLLDSVSNNTLVKEIIIVDSPESIDNIDIILNNPKIRYVQSIKAGRAAQLNYGAQIAKSEILYFVHADTILPKSFDTLILNEINKGVDLGCFRFKFDSNHVLLKINSFFTRFPFLWCRGGDQSLFIKKSVYDSLNGFDESFVIMEEYDLLKRAKEKYRFGIINESVIVSARKYEKNGYFKIQYANFRAMKMFFTGKYSPCQIKEFYQNELNLNY